MLGMHIVLQASVNATEVINEVMNSVVGPAFNILLTIGGLAFLVGIGAILYNLYEYVIHPTSFGRSGALSEVFGHHKRLIGGAFGTWLSIYLIFLIAAMLSGQANPAQVASTAAWQVLEAMFTNLLNYAKLAMHINA
ncbi:hypothetical protein VMUT_1011 [Vulcanisaeta moutnovskia 768-28]|uniref:Uncharacterized protein n=1 Tax=Vulcanisaeta moutnovskia (strain 768-28) TaxID=985053 RepID=F0QXQ5_VULM7|nr:hypothetical protein [Vulcanisaeta moutnovskia]ADY01218.1 hypothetical protein VMUT_1011 [Vulcanisaeta moutnovskia 768-28]